LLKPLAYERRRSDHREATATLEPVSNYRVVRGNQDYAGGNGSLGFIVTAVNRSLDATSSPYLHESAYAGGVDTRRRFGGRYEVSA
jgi:hypothetical protein